MNIRQKTLSFVIFSSALFFGGVNASLNKINENQKGFDISNHQGQVASTLQAGIQSDFLPVLADKVDLPRNARNNNPGNIKDFGDKWVGMTGVDSGGDVAEGNFVVFDKPEHGVRALTRDLTTKRNGGHDTIKKIIHRFAPNGKENDTKSYIADVSTDVGIASDVILKDTNIFKLVKAITKHEGGKKSFKIFTDNVIKVGMNMAYPDKYPKSMAKTNNHNTDSKVQIK